MYHKHFGLDEQAFSIAVNPRYLYMSAQHKEALAHLLYGVNSGGFVMLSGEVGTGKTTIIRCLLEQLPENADVSVVMNPSEEAPDLLRSICEGFGVNVPAEEENLKVLTDTLRAFLQSNHQQGYKSIVLIDEAQLLRVSTLEQVRLLTNLETTTEKLLQIILVGQPELNELLARPALRQLSQRITARYHLRPLSEEETEAYINHRLSIAGLEQGRIKPFPANIIRRIFKVSGGIPRLINVLCDRMLLGAYGQGVESVDRPLCQKAITEVLDQPENRRPSRSNTGIYVLVIVGTSLILAAAVMLFMNQQNMKQALLEVGATGGDQTNGVEEVRVSALEPPVNSLRSEKSQPSNTPEPARSSNLSQGQPYYFLQKSEALGSLISVLGIDQIGSTHCDSLLRRGWECLNEEASHWQAWMEVDRPSILTITTENKLLAYVVLLRIEGMWAWLSTEQGLVKQRLVELGPQWTGEFQYLWKRPPYYSERPMSKGDRGPMVNWLAEQFARLDGQQNPISEGVYSALLAERVKIFQRSHGLIADGLAGRNTLLKLNEVMGYDVTSSRLQLTETTEPDRAL